MTCRLQKCKFPYAPSPFNFHFYKNFDLYPYKNLLILPAIFSGTLTRFIWKLAYFTRHKLYFKLKMKSNLGVRKILNNSCLHSLYILKFIYIIKIKFKICNIVHFNSFTNLKKKSIILQNFNIIIYSYHNVRFYNSFNL